MVPSRRDRDKGKAIDDSTNPETDRSDNLSLGRLVPIPKKNIDFMLDFRNRSLTPPKYDILSTFPASCFNFLELLTYQGFRDISFRFWALFSRLCTNFLF